MIDPEDWGEKPPQAAVEVLRLALCGARDGMVILTKERTAHILARFNQLRTTLKIKGAVRIPLIGRIGK